MKCPYCGSFESRVVDKRDNRDEGITRRRRECFTCTKRFTTYERVESIELDVLKRDGTIEKFNREKLRRGLLRALNKRPVNNDQIDITIEDIEMKLLNRRKTIIRSTEIGKLVLNRLKKLDSVAYMRFASVYKDFNSIEDFVNELNLLRKRNAAECDYSKK